MVQLKWGTIPSLYRVSQKTEIPLVIYYNNYPLRGILVQLFTEPSDGHAAFTTLLRLDASFVMMPRALHLEHPAAPDSPLVLRPKPVNLRLGRHATFSVSTRVQPPPGL